MALTHTLTDSPSTRRAERFAVQRLLWEHSALPRVRACGSRPSSNDFGVGIRHTTGLDGSRTAGFSGIQTCGSVWACAECNAKIASRRAEEVADGVRRWLESGGQVILLTLTVRHSRFNHLRGLLDAVQYAWTKALSGRGWADDQARWGSPVGSKIRIPYVRALESTHGDTNGWHPHVHALLFVRGLEQRDADDLGLAVFERWQRAVVRRGYEAPTTERGVDAKLIYPDSEGGVGDAAKYLVKAGWELAGGAAKLGKRGSVTPFGILRRFWETGDMADLDLWREWERATKGRRQLTWSRGLRDLLGIGAEADDQEIVDEALEGETLGYVDAGDWRHLRYRKADLLAAAETLPLAFLRSAPPSLWLVEWETRYGGKPAST